jgi:DNA-binding HxlR family transcriptional regulator
VDSDQFGDFYTTIDVFRHRWTLEILTALHKAPSRYTDLMQALTPTPHAKSLTGALHRMLEHGLIHQAASSHYELTPAGVTLLPLLLDLRTSLRQWTKHHGPPSADDRAPWNP